MHYSIYEHLKTNLHTTLQKAYPEQYQKLASIPVTFSSITPDPQTDIATPYPLKISQFLGLPVATVSQQILDHFQINRNYLSNTAEDLFYRGFFNFRLSDTFLLRSVYETALANSTVDPLPVKNKPEIINKIEVLLQKNEPQNLPPLDLFIPFSLSHSTAEYKAARVIALSNPDGIHSVKTCDYFTQQLLNEVNNSYRKCPIQTDDYPLSMLRFLIFKAIYTRVTQLASIKQVYPLK